MGVAAANEYTRAAASAPAFDYSMTKAKGQTEYYKRMMMVANDHVCSDTYLNQCWFQAGLAEPTETSNQQRIAV